MLYDNSKGLFKVYNLDRAKERFLPASTFKIFNALAGLETGVIRDTSFIIKWDGIVRESPEWNQDLSLQHAFRVSAVPYFQEVARRIGKDTMQKWLDTIKYGNMKLSRIDTFWLDNSLQISSDEQLGFVKKLYFDQLPFRKSTMQWVRGIMLMEKTGKYELSYKTGWGINGRQKIGWVAGWVEENGHPTFYVLNIGSEDPNIEDTAKGDVRLNMLKSILEEEGYFKGLK